MSSSAPAPAPALVSAPGLDDLSDGLLLVDLLPRLCPSALLSLFEVSTRWNRLCREHLVPRHTLIEVDDTSDSCPSLVTARRTPYPRMSREVPRLDELRMPGHLRMAAEESESELTVDMKSVRHLIPTQHLLRKIAEVCTRMRHTAVLHLLCARTSGDPLRELLATLPVSVCESLHTLCVHYPTLAGYRSLALFPFSSGLSTLTGLGVLKLERTGVDIALLADLPRLASLHLSRCNPVRAWPTLSALSGLRDLRLFLDAQRHITAALASVRVLTGLSDVRLGLTLTTIRIARDVCSAVAQLTALRTLCLKFEAHPAAFFPDVQGAVEVLSMHLHPCPGLRHLELSLPLNVPLRGVPVPVELTCLETLDVSHASALPQPSHIRTLRAPYDALPYALGCRGLRELTCRRAVVEPEPSERASLLAAVHGGAWPRLNVLLMPLLPASSAATLLHAVLPRPTVRHVLARRDPATEVALCALTSLRTLTLVGDDGLRGLAPILRLPRLTLLELVGCVDQGSVGGWSTTDRVTVRATAELDACARSKFDWHH